MDGRFKLKNMTHHQFYSSGDQVLEDEDDHYEEKEKAPDSQSANSSAKKGRRGMKKKVVSVRINGEIPRNNCSATATTTPPSDSWAWRKYGQKPIKGSPYPRAYYRCSSSKGCPARKQVERNRLDPTMLLITYSSDHNHSGPLSRNSNNNNHAALPKPASPKIPAVQPDPEPEPEENFVDMGHESSLITIRADEFTWFGEMETTSSTVLESSIFSTERSIGIGDSISSDDQVAMVFPMGDDDESLFADLGELPECSVVFRHGGGGRGFPPEEQPRPAAQRRITPWCATGTTT